MTPHEFLLLLSLGPPVKLLFLSGSGIGTLLPTKIGSVVETVILALSLITHIDAYHFSILIGMSL